MDEFEVLSKESFKKILNAAEKSNLSLDFTNSVMGQLATIGVKNKIYKRYMNRSLGLFILTVFLALAGIYVFANIEIAIQGATNNLIAQAFNIFIYTLISVLSGLIFYQLNNLLSYRFAEIK